MKTKSSHIIISLAATICILASSCVKNDIPYPRIQANFLTFSVVGQEKDATVDSLTRSITVYLPETVDIENVTVDEYTISPDAELIAPDLTQPLNLTKTVLATLHIYQDWVWSIKAQQDISRYFTVNGQVGSSMIDVPGKRVVAYVSKRASLKSVTVESIKLGPEGSTVSPDILGKTVDFTHPVEVEVTSFGRTTTWTLFVERSNADVSTVGADAWTNVAWLYGQGEASNENGFEYRLAGAEEWTRVPDSDIVKDGGSFSTRLIHLSPLTTYEARAFSGEAHGETLQFTTGSAVQVPNSSLDDWWLDGKVWDPWPKDGEQYWDTGNKGATTLGASNSVPTEDTSTGSGLAAMLETKFVGIGVLGKLAAGNLFAGKFVRTDGTNGILSFGQPFSERPTKLRGYLKYTSTLINYSSSEWEQLKGQPDTCIVWVALIDSPEPFEIRTNPKNRHLFDPDGAEVIAYGKYESGQSITSYEPFEFELEYKSTSRVPKYILITASASKYGDYFTGGAGSVLFLDNLELLYDY